MLVRYSPGGASGNGSVNAPGIAPRSLSSDVCTSSDGCTSSDVRNIALAGHSGAGKTSLIEAILFVAGCSDRQGKVDDGSSALDFDPESVRRKISVQLSLAHCAWENQQMTWADTPGAPDFAGDFAAALRAVDDALLVSPPLSGDELEFGLEAAFDGASGVHKPEAIFINKMDREHADFFGTVAALRARFGRHVVPATLPIGAGPSFSGIVDLVTMTAHVGAGRDLRQVPIPPEMVGLAAAWRQMLVEIAAEGDDELIEEFLEGKELTEDEIERGIHEDLLSGRIVPIFCGSALKCIGVQPLLTHLAREFEGPDEAPAAMGVSPATGKEISRPCDDSAPFSALVFKTVADPYVGKITCFRVHSGVLRPDSVIWNATREREERIGPLFRLRGKQQEPVTMVRAGEIAAVAKLSATATGDTLCDRANPILYPAIRFPAPRFTVAIHARTKTDEDKLGGALLRVLEEDPCLRHRRDEETSETLLEGLGETHIEVAIARLARFGANVEARTPRIAYRETIAGSARAQGKHKKQTGGRGQFGDCWLKVEPAPPGAGFEFVDKVVGGAIPRQYIPAVEKGVHEAMKRGVLAGYPLVDIRATVDDGSFHPVDSSEAAFHMAGILAFHNAVAQAHPKLLEPVHEITVTIPDARLGDIMGDLSSRRGHVIGIEPADKPGYQTVRAHVPAALLQTYVTDLRALARGRGDFCARLSHYAETPPAVAEPLVSEYKNKA